MHKEGTNWSRELFIMPFPKKMLGDLESEGSVSRISNNAVVSFSLKLPLCCNGVVLYFKNVLNLIGAKLSSTVEMDEIRAFT